MLQPLLDEQGNVKYDKKGRIQPDKGKTSSEIIPFTYEGGIDAYMDAEVRPYTPELTLIRKLQKSAMKLDSQNTSSFLVLSALLKR